MQETKTRLLVFHLNQSFEVMVCKAQALDIESGYQNDKHSVILHFVFFL